MMFYVIGAILIAFIGIFISRWSGWKRDIHKQILIFDELRNRLPEANESNLASRMIKLKLKTVKNKSLQSAYEDLAKQGGLTLKTALYFIVEYDYIRGRGLNPLESGPQIFLRKAKEYIDMRLTSESNSNSGDKDYSSVDV